MRVNFNDGACDAGNLNDLLGATILGDIFNCFIAFWTRKLVEAYK